MVWQTNIYAENFGPADQNFHERASCKETRNTIKRDIFTRCKFSLISWEEPCLTKIYASCSAQGVITCSISAGTYTASNNALHRNKVWFMRLNHTSNMTAILSHICVTHYKDTLQYVTNCGSPFVNRYVQQKDRGNSVCLSRWQTNISPISYWNPQVLVHVISTWNHGLNSQWWHGNWLTRWWDKEYKGLELVGKLWTFAKQNFLLRQKTVSQKFTLVKISHFTAIFWLAWNHL